MIGRFLTAFALALAIAPACASAGGWTEVEGARLRLLADDAAGSIRGLLQIELEPGWKTYWRDPGDAGIPPSIAPESAGVAGTTLLFPVPRRFHEPGSVWAGYDGPVDLPVVFTLENETPPRAVAVSLFLGVCRDICVPVQARLEAKVPAPDARQREAIDAAFDALPRPAGPQAVEAVTVVGKEVRVTFGEGAAGADELFVSGPPSWSLGEPRPVSGAASTFAFEVLYRPKAASLQGADFSYTAVRPGGAVEGTFRTPGP